MRHIIRFVNSLENLDPRKFAGEILILPDGSVYQAQASDELGGFLDVFKKIGQVTLPLAGVIAAPFTGGMSVAAAATLTSALTAAGSVAGGLISAFGSGSGGNGQQAKGLAAIQAKGQEVINAFGTLQQKIQSDAQFTKSDAYTAADKLVAILSNPSEFYPAKNGKDAEALANFKTQAAQLAAQAKQMADAVDASRQKTTTALSTTGANGGQVVRTVDHNGNVVSVIQPASSLPFGLSATELLIGAGAIYFLFIRQTN